MVRTNGLGSASPSSRIAGCEHIRRVRAGPCVLRVPAKDVLVSYVPATEYVFASDVRTTELVFLYESAP